MRSTCLAASLVVLSVLCSYAQRNDHPVPEGRIIGTVIDADGNPVPNITVSANNCASSSEEPEADAESAQSSEPTPKKDKSPKGSSRWLDEVVVVGPVNVHEATTNDNGEFEIRGLDPWKYSLVGSNNEYPEDTLMFTDGTPSAVILTTEIPVAHVVVKVGLKGGIVRGSVTDKSTGKPVRAGFYVFRFDDGRPWQWIASSASESFSYLIPAGVPAALEPTAEGYKPVCVFVRLGPGEQKVVNLELEPAPSKPPTPSATTGCQLPKSETPAAPNP